MAGDGKPKKDARGKGQSRKKKPQGKKGGNGKSTDLVSAVAHETRRRILREMQDQGDTPISPAQLSNKVTAPLSAVSYHVRVLEKYGAIRLVDERQVRGALEHFYISLIRDNPTLRALLNETERMDEESRERIRRHEEKIKREGKEMKRKGKG